MRQVEGTMTLEECYEKMGGDYAEVLARLVNEERIGKYVLKFLEDPTYQMLCDAKKAGDSDEVFRAIHTLKGVSQNLGFGKLYKASYEMTEAVRGGKTLADERMFEAVKKAYFETIDVIRQYTDAI